MWTLHAEGEQLIFPRDTDDRTTHAQWVDPALALTHDLVRYNRQGRWYVETFKHEDLARQSPAPSLRERKKVIHEAVEAALAMEAAGGQVYPGRSGGGRFDYMVDAAKTKRARH